MARTEAATYSHSMGGRGSQLEGWWSEPACMLKCLQAIRWNLSVNVIPYISENTRTDAVNGRLTHVVEKLCKNHLVKTAKN